MTLPEIKAWLEQLHWIAPWAVLAVASYLAELVLFSARVHAFLCARFPKTAEALPKIKGIWATIIGAAWAAGTTGDPENAVWGAVSGVVIPIVLRFKKEISAASVMLLICCSPAASREACYGETRARFHLNSEQCETESCIDKLSEIEASELKDCR